MDVESSTLNNILEELKLIREENNALRNDYIKLYSKLYSLTPEELDKLGLHDELFEIKSSYVEYLTQASQESGGKKLNSVKEVDSYLDNL